MCETTATKQALSPAEHETMLVYDLSSHVLQETTVAQGMLSHVLQETTFLIDLSFNDLQ